LKITASRLDPLILSESLGTNFIFLNLSNNNLSSDSPIFDRCANLEFINLSFNKLKCLSFLSKCNNLKEIHACNNEIQELDGLTNIKNLNLLEISNNMIVNYETVAALACNKKLDLLNLKGNPLAKQPNYRKNIQRLVPQLKGLDLNDYTVNNFFF
jgi:hypothetical protein